jgi:4-alpha-glucanotransferase
VDLAAWGVDDGYWDVSGRWRDVPRDSLDAITRAIGVEGDRPPPGPPLWFVRAGHVEFLLGPADLVLEDGSTIRGVEALPRDLPPGYHDLVPLDGGPTTRLVVTPGRCHLQHDLRTWGWALQLYAARSKSSWGIGDLADLRELQDWATKLGAGVLAINPLHAGSPTLPQQASPYYPSSRCFRSPIYLRVEDVPGAAEAGAPLVKLAAAGRDLNRRRLIDRDAIWRLKCDALELCFAHFTGDERFDSYVRDQGVAIDRFATYCAIAEVHGADWRHWPSELRRPDDSGVSRFAGDHGNRIRFHMWLQWLLDEQVAATSSFPVIHDLAVGFDPGGADAWVWQDVLALDMRVGAPPDDFNPNGQNWGLPPFVPWKLRQAHYAPFIDTLRACFRHAGGLRIDHVMGLFRLFWLPADGGPGGYVRYPAHELLDIVALESHRARAFVLGEDLGTVEDSVRAELHERQVLSYRLLWFEHEPPESYPEDAVAALTTHDLPTLAGVWTASDRQDQRDAGLSPNDSGEDEVRNRLARAVQLGSDAAVTDVSVAAYRALSRAPSRVVLATLDDALSVSERPNMPGTVDEWPNWSIALPRPIEELEEDPHVNDIATAIGEGR